MSSCPAAVEAIVQLARKKRLIDRAQAARLRVLLPALGATTVQTLQQALPDPRLVPHGVSKVLLEALPAADAEPIGCYTPLAHLAEGGMGSVMLGADPQGNLVVIKTVREQFANHPEVRHRFVREASLMQSLQHPHVVRCLDSGESAQGILFMVLEFIDGGDIKDLVASQGTLPEALALALLYQASDALVLAEARALVHRDIKPANIFATPEGWAKLADFGIARSTAAGHTMLTMEGALIGSPAYMSPEQCRGEPDLDIGVDIYALGVVLYYTLTACEPYQGKLQDVLHQHCTAPIPDVRTLRPHVQAYTAAIVERCLQKERRDRFASASELRDACRNALLGLEGHGPVRLGAVQPNDLPTMTANLNQHAPSTDTGATMTADLSGAESAQSARPSAPISASLDSDLTIAADLNDPATALGSTLTYHHHGPEAVPDDTALETALDCDWLALVGPGGLLVQLWAKRLLDFGKLCEAPVQVCLRKYPSTIFRDDCLRISRTHLRLHLDLDLGSVCITDLGSGNGTFFDGNRLQGNQAVPLLAERLHQVNVAGSLNLIMKAISRHGTEAWEATVAGALDSHCGLELPWTWDGVAITRPDNRPEMVYGLVLRRLSLGGPGADLELPGLSRDTRIDIGRYRERWVFRRHQAEPWRPLVPGWTWPEAKLSARPGDYPLFHG